MRQQQLISLKKVCLLHDLNEDFIYLIKEYEILEIIEKEPEIFIYDRDLPKVERVIRLYKELGVNMEGIDIITNMISHMDELHNEIRRLKNRVRALQ